MKQWQLVQHKIGGEFKYSFSLVDIENNVMQLIVSIDTKLNENGNLVAIKNTIDKKLVCVISPSELLDLIIEISQANSAIIGYGEKVND